MPKNPLAKFNELLLKLNPYEYTTLAYILGLLICDGLDGPQMESIGNFYELVGQTILTMGAQYENMFNFQSPTTTPNVDDAVKEFKEKFGNLGNIITEFRKDVS